MNGKLIKIRGKKLYIEIHGEHNSNAVLYLHGGPGESCFDFSYHQAERLSKKMKLIAIDQRGVCRSEEIADSEQFGLDDIIDDCEALREYLNIGQWSLIGHSFGGFLAIKYACLYPDSINKIILEGPTFDFKLTTLALLSKTAQLAEKYEMEDLKNQCLLLNDQNSTIQLLSAYMDLSYQLGENRMEIYTYNFNNPTDYALYTQEEWDLFDGRAEVHYNRLREEGKIYDSLLPSLGQVKAPMLLLLGKYDPVTCPKQVKAFEEHVKFGDVFIFDKSGHTPHYEEEEFFGSIAIDYLNS
ncbi:alpha/beta fold hydrolase [Bacillus infantis]|uniref:alpha/beta fold hydrolase n=1 Tax=Bacillus infantis TaxID=324767 RepID=UPI003CF785CB